MEFMHDLGQRAKAATPSALAGVPAGLVAGIAYLLAQAVFAVTAYGGTGAEPFQRIAAILLGPDAAPPPGEWTSLAIGMALIIHVPLSAVYGRIVDVLVMRFDHLPLAAALGAVFGALLYLVNFHAIAPAAFPWFEDSRTLATAADHVLFGVVAAVACVALRRQFGARGRL